MTEGEAQAIEEIRAFIAAGRLSDATRLSEDFLRGAPTPATACIFQALLLTLAGRVNDAIGQYEEALALAPDALPAYMGIADILADKGWLSSAVVVLDNARASTHFTNAAHEQLNALQYRLAKTSPAIRETQA